MSAVLRATLLFLGLPLVLGSGPVMALAADPGQAQPRVGQPDRITQARFRAMDRNNDGVITRDEWNGTEQSFRVHDWNRDGMLSGDEVVVGGRRRANPDEWDFDPAASDVFDDWTDVGFNRLDRNRDGRVTRSEWFFNNEAFTRADRDGDNVLTRREFIIADIDDDREDRFEYLDANSNGRIERSEWHGSADAFQWLDRNRNGWLSRAEVVGTTTANAPRTDQFGALDVDRTGTIEPDEWFWSRRSFDQRDLNRDGRVTRREFTATADTTIDTSVRTPVPQAAARAFRIRGTDAWTNTGIYVRAGDQVTIQAEGTVTLSDNPNDAAGPAGSYSNRTAKNAPLPQARAGMLLARVGNSGVRAAGDRITFNAQTSGEVWLGINDDHMPDNAGEFRVTVTTQPATVR